MPSRSSQARASSIDGYSVLLIVVFLSAHAGPVCEKSQFGLNRSERKRTEKEREEEDPGEPWRRIVSVGHIDVVPTQPGPHRGAENSFVFRRWFESSSPASHDHWLLWRGGRHRL